ncbi:MAG: tetratricopeptide repeat protein [Phycisphaera sp.]|nr:tetratricopeptide repeat protein [Phycisphaera sp.]
MSKTRYCLFIVAVTLAAAAVCVFAASPRFYLWQGLNVTEMVGLPEINRAVSTQHQIDEPFAPVVNPSNAIIRWRLLFPLLANAASMPFSVYLALPFVGVLLLLGTVTHVVHRDTGDAWLAALSAGLAGTMSWFFVSTGWLTYFDSWYLLGALVVATARPMWAVAAAVLLCPWIDERFVLMLPLCWVARASTSGWVRGRMNGQAIRQSAWVVGLLTPYLLFRVAMMLVGGGASTSGDYLTRVLFGEWSAAANLPYVAAGAWYGLRLAWVVAMVFLLLSKRLSKGSGWVVFVWGGVALGLVGNLILTGDYSRSTSVMLPVVIAGIVLAGRLKLPRRRSVLAALLLLNLLLPVAHVFGPRVAAIEWFPSAWHTYRNPEGTLVDPAYHIRGGNLAMQVGKPDAAITEFTWAIELDPHNYSALLGRAVAYATVGDWRSALPDIDAAIERAPKDWPEAEPARLLRQRAIGELEHRQPTNEATPSTPR